MEEDIQLAECVREHPCLYDLKNANYKDQQIRDNVWKLISNDLNYKSGRYYTYSTYSTY